MATSDMVTWRNGDMATDNSVRRPEGVGRTRHWPPLPVFRHRDRRNNSLSLSLSLSPGGRNAYSNTLRNLCQWMFSGRRPCSKNSSASVHMHKSVYQSRHAMRTRGLDVVDTVRQSRVRSSSHDVDGPLSSGSVFGTD